MRHVLFVASLFFALLGDAATPDLKELCGKDEYKLRTLELKRLFDADQADRQDFQHWTQARGIQVLKRDRKRLKRIAEIFAQGCLKSAEDYYHAATVFQHGEVPDHFYQTYIWAYHAFKMGYEPAGMMAGNGIDRYLMNLGMKQLYGGQAHSESQGCFCIWPIEESFPDSKRREIKFRTREEILAWVKELNQEKPNCPNSFCSVEVKPTPQGSIPGVW